jgi:hypothetical protein
VKRLESGVNEVVAEEAEGDLRAGPFRLVTHDLAVRREGDDVPEQQSHRTPLALVEDGIAIVRPIGKSRRTQVVERHLAVTDLDGRWNATEQALRTMAFRSEEDRTTAAPGETLVAAGAACRHARICRVRNGQPYHPSEEWVDPPQHADCIPI